MAAINAKTILQKRRSDGRKKGTEVKKRSLIFLLLSTLSAAPSGVLGITERQPDWMAAKKEPLIFLRLLASLCGQLLGSLPRPWQIGQNALAEKGERRWKNRA
jgi:hypothetical protein